MKYFLVFGLYFLAIHCKAQKISGYVKDSATHEFLPGAVIIDAESKAQTATNAKGYFAIKTRNNPKLSVTFIGYSKKTIQLTLHSDTFIIVLLQASPEELNEINIYNKSGNDLRNPLQEQYLNPAKIDQLPALLGESDVMKSLTTTTAGVKQIEGQQGLNVRGSSQDQNLILYDDAIIYNCSHLLGFYSVFNTMAIQNVTFYKSGIPARYGGRLSSAMSIESSSGNMEKWQNNVSFGLLGANVSFQGPIIKNRLSISISGRRSYIDKIVLPLVNKFLDSTVSPKSNGYFFQDYNATITFKPSANNKFEWFGYTGNDAFTLDKQGNAVRNYVVWGNTATGLSWRYGINSNLSMLQSFTMSSYHFTDSISQSLYAVNLSTGIKTSRYRNEWLITKDDKPIRIGLELQYHTYIPNDIDAKVNNFSLNFGKSVNLHAIENALYFEYPLLLGTRWNVLTGLRISQFSHLGPYVRYTYDDVGHIADSTVFNNGNVVKTFINPEPRFSASYLIDDSSSIKLSAGYNVQYSNLIPIMSTALPAEMWLPATKGINPQKSIQLSGGYFLSKYKHIFSAEAYIKSTFDKTESKDNMLNLYYSGDYSQLMTQGFGYAYGIELTVEKPIGRWNYMVSYTFSRSIEIFKDLNNGLPFPSNYDKPHDFTATSSYKLSDKWSVSALFTFSSGSVMTEPVARYLVQSNIVNVYGTRNGYRMRPYNRADLSIKYLIRTRPTYKMLGIFSIVNVYDRHNPYYMYYNTTGSLEQYQIKMEKNETYLFPILPSLTFEISF